MVYFSDCGTCKASSKRVNKKRYCKRDFGKYNQMLIPYFIQDMSSILLCAWHKFMCSFTIDVKPQTIISCVKVYPKWQSSRYQIGLDCGSLLSKNDIAA